MDLLALEDFNLVATHGGFGKAARASGRPKATLSRHVMELEESLGVRLLERGARSLRLTEQGSLLFTRSGSLLGELAELGESIGEGQDRPRGLLRVSVPLLFSHIAIGPIAARFSAAHPEVRMEIVAEDRMVDLIDEGFDVCVRTNPRPDEGLVGRLIIRDHLLLVAAPGIPRPAPESEPSPIRAIMTTASPTNILWTISPTIVAPKTGSDLIKKESIASKIKSDPVFQETKQVFRPEAVLRLSSMVMVRDAALAGAGAAMLPRSLVDTDLAAGRLVEWGRAAGREVEVWVLHTSRRLASPKVSAFVEFLVAEFAHKSLLGYRQQSPR